MKRKPEHILDELLVMQCQAGDETALAALVQRWQKPLWRRARTLTDSPEAAKDLTQEAWVAIIRGLDRLRDPSRFPFWAYNILKHKAVDRIRKRQRQRAAQEEMFHLGQDTGHAEAEDAREEQITRLRLMLARLPEERRELLRLYYQEGLSLALIARRLDVPEGTVKSRLFHARAALKKYVNAARHEKVK